MSPHRKTLRVAELAAQHQRRRRCHFFITHTVCVCTNGKAMDEVTDDATKLMWQAGGGGRTNYAAHNDD